MPYIQYIEKRFSDASLKIIDHANTIIAEYDALGYQLTLRQLYYQFVSRLLIPNTQTDYKRLGSIMNDARLAGLVDWNSLHDLTRNLDRRSTWTEPSSILHSAAHSYHEDPWDAQDIRVEVWIEKDALSGVVLPVCESYTVPFLSCRGYISQSEMWSSAERINDIMRNGQDVVVLHFSDHDPSGIDMTEDLRKRLTLFCGEAIGWELYRIALTYDQVMQYGLPPNPAKVTDSRYKAYSDQYGYESWELDALDPEVLSDLVESEIKTFIRTKRWDKSVRACERSRKKLTKLAEQWDTISKQL